MIDRTYLILDPSHVWGDFNADGSSNVEAALARMHGLTLQPADWLRLLTLARVTAMTASLEHDGPDVETRDHIPLDDGYLGDLLERMAIEDRFLGADGVLNALRSLPLTASGWRRVLLTAHVMAALLTREEAFQ